MTSTLDNPRTDGITAPSARRELVLTLVKRFVGCIAGSVVLAMMWGEQQGSDEDYGLAFHEAVLDTRIFVFLGIGVGTFLAITFGTRLVPYLTRPGAPALLAGAVVVLASYTLLKWYDPKDDGKLNTLSDAVEKTTGLSFVSSAFFDWYQWTGLILTVVIGVVAVVTGLRVLAWVSAAIALVTGVVAVIAKQEVVDFTGAIDHSLGSYVALAGFLVMAVAMASAAVSKAQVTATRASLDRALGRWPGLPLAVLGGALCLAAFTFVTWFSPLRLNADLADTHDVFDGSGLEQIALVYLGWLAWVLLVVALAAAVVAAFTGIRALGWIAVGVGVVATVITLVTLYKMSKLAADLGTDEATGAWQNLGVGGWVACTGFLLIAGAGFFAATAAVGRDVLPAGGDPALEPSTGGAVPTTKPGQGGSAMSRLRARGGSAGLAVQRAGGSPVSRNLVVVIIALALFFPPTMTAFWQTVLVSQIGVYVLLAVGLNVVVGWAGLLDLGYIAFFALGSYTTAYLVGSLPIKPPSWLEMPPLAAIPFAIAVCLIAGVALGAPTLRLRGDYLAIVTLGFGEIIRLFANNASSVTNGPSGVRPALPHPAIHVGPVNVTWSLNPLQYWYLLLIIIVLVVIAFHRLEGSRLGRAWSAIREDEVAAQATGINTTKVKLLAFAIGASTSGLAGVYFASQVGYFNPDNFLLVNSILVVAYVVFGGMGSLPGAMAGAAALTWLPEFLKDQVPEADRQMWIGLVLLLMMIFRPSGLFPAKRRKAELEGLHGDDSASVRAVPAAEGS